MGDAERIRRLAARKVEPDEIAARLELRPALVHRVLARSAQRGAPRIRGTGTTLSFATSPETADRLRERAAERGVSLSNLIDATVREALSQQGATPEPAASRPRSRKRPGAARRTAPAAVAGEAPRGSRHRTAGSVRTTSAPTTAADAPEAVVKLLKSYDPRSLRWRKRDHRHLIVLAILTRGNEEARQWLWSILSEERVRELVRSYRGAGCAEPDRAELRKQLGLTTTDIPISHRGRISEWSAGLERERPRPREAADPRASGRAAQGPSRARGALRVLFTLAKSRWPRSPERGARDAGCLRPRERVPKAHSRFWL